MSRYNTSDPLRGSGINRSIAAPGVTPTPVIPNQTFGQLGNVLRDAMRGTAAYIDFKAGAEELRLQREAIAARNAERLRIEQERAAAEQAQQDAKTIRLQEGLGVQAAQTLDAAILNDISTAQIALPESNDPQALEAWADTNAERFAQRAGVDSSPAAREAFKNSVKPKMVAAYFNQLQQTVEEDRKFAIEKAVSTSLNADGPGVAVLDETASNLRLTPDQATQQLYIPRAHYLSQAGRVDELKAMGERVAPTFKGQYDQLVRIAENNKQANELNATRAAFEPFTQRLTQLNPAPGEQADIGGLFALRADLQKFSESNPAFADEANARVNSVDAIINSSFAANAAEAERQYKISVQNKHLELRQQILQNASNLYRSGNAWAIPDSGKTAVTLNDGTIDEKSVTGLQELARNSAIEAEPTMEGRVRLLSGDDGKYKPYAALLEVGPNAGDTQFSSDGKPIVNERSISALGLYRQMSEFDPEVARKHAGKNAEWYESVLEIMREPGIGNDPAKAISEQVRRSGLGTADVPAYTPENAKQDAQKIDGIDDSNYFEVAGVLRSTYTRLVRSGVSPERAREISVSMAGSQVQVVNGHTFFAGEHATPPGAYGSFKDTAEAYLDWLKQEHPNVRAFNEPVDWDSVRFSMNQKTGKITLVSEFNQPLDIPVSQREFNVTKLLALAAQAKKNGVIARASKPKEMRKYDNGPNSIPWSKVPGAAAVGLRDFANFWDERIAKPSVAKPISFENFPIPARGPIDDALQAAGQYWDKNVAEKSRLKPVSFDYGQGQ